MSTLEAYVRKAIDLAGEKLMGRYAPLTAAAAQTSTAGSLAFGGNNEQMFVQWYMWRPAATTTTDHDKQIDSWVPSTGVFTHSGSAYSDTTATSETLYLFPPDLPPMMVRTAVNTAIQMMREWDETIVPIVANADEHWVHDLDWLEDAASIRWVKWNHNPVITRNRYLQKRHSYSTGGVLQPDDWTVASNADSTPWTATNYRGQKYYYSLQRSTTNATLTQTVGTMLTGVSTDYPVGETITAVVVATAAATGNIRNRISDYAGGANTDNSLTTPLEETTVTRTLSGSASEMTQTVSAIADDNSHEIYEAYMCIGELTDAVRRDNFPAYTIPNNQYSFEQGAPLKIQHPQGMGRGQLIICSERPFPEFDSTRLASGAADTDSSDAPLTDIATGVVALCLEQRYGPDNAIAKLWRHKFDLACRKHLAYPTGNTGVPLLNGPFTRSAMRVR